MPKSKPSEVAEAVQQVCREHGVPISSFVAMQIAGELTGVVVVEKVVEKVVVKEVAAQVAVPPKKQPKKQLGPLKGPHLHFELPQVVKWQGTKFVDPSKPKSISLATAELLDALRFKLIPKDGGGGVLYSLISGPTFQVEATDFAPSMTSYELPSYELVVSADLAPVGALGAGNVGSVNTTLGVSTGAMTLVHPTSWTTAKMVLD